ncbi:hypothetical protein DSECCO2_638660 [anaerobic digester metagenome]
MLHPRLPDQVRGQEVGERAPRILDRDDDLTFRVEDLCRLGHKPDTTDDNQVSPGFLCLHRDLKAVTHNVGKPLDLQGLVVMRHDNCILPGFKRTDPLFHRYVPTTRGFSRFFKSVRMERAAI